MFYPMFIYICIFCIKGSVSNPPYTVKNDLGLFAQTSPIQIFKIVQQSPALIKLDFKVDLASIQAEETKFLGCITELLSRTYISQDKANTEAVTKIIRDKVAGAKQLYTKLKTRTQKLNEFGGHTEIPNTANDQCYIHVENKIIDTILENFGICEICKGHAPESSVAAIANALKHVIGNYMSLLYLGFRKAISQTNELMKYTELLTTNKFPPTLMADIELIGSQQKCNIEPFKMENIQVLGLYKGQDSIACPLYIIQYQQVQEETTRLVSVAYENFVPKSPNLIFNKRLSTVADVSHCKHMNGNPFHSMSEPLICDTLTWYSDPCVSADFQGNTKNIMKHCTIYKPFDKRTPQKVKQGILFSHNKDFKTDISWKGQTIAPLPNIIESQGQNIIIYRLGTDGLNLSDNGKLDILHLSKYSKENLNNFTEKAINKQPTDFLPMFWEEVAIMSGLSVQALFILMCLICTCRIITKKHKLRNFKAKHFHSIILPSNRRKT